jgi:hypothetical protein
MNTDFKQKAGSLLCLSVALLYCALVKAADLPATSANQWWSSAVENRRAEAGRNWPELALALADVAPDQREGLQFLIENMSSADLHSLSATFLLTNVVLAYAAWEKAPWHTKLPKDIFLNDVLPYASLNETREPSRSELQGALRGYVARVLGHEWKEMAASKYLPDPAPEQRIWDVLLNVVPANSQQQVFLDKSVDQMTQLSDFRRLRYVYYSADLPSVIWIVIYVGCAITIGFSYFFVARFRQQAIMCGTFAALIGLTILAISELATPYQGAVVVSDQAFRIVALAINAPGAVPGASGVPARLDP